MKRINSLFTIIITVIIATVTFTACSNINPERKYPKPGYIQTAEILPSQHPLEALMLNADKDTVSINEYFRVNAKVNFENDDTEWITLSTVETSKITFTTFNGMIQTNINEFVALQPGNYEILGEYTANGATKTAKTYIVCVDN